MGPFEDARTKPLNLLFQKPFNHGWRRELLVTRPLHSDKDVIIVSYLTPRGVRVGNHEAIRKLLNYMRTRELSTRHFSFAPMLISNHPNEKLVDLTATATEKGERESATVPVKKKSRHSLKTDDNSECVPPVVVHSRANSVPHNRKRSLDNAFINDAEGNIANPVKKLVVERHSLGQPLQTKNTSSDTHSSIMPNDQSTHGSPIRVQTISRPKEIISINAPVDRYVGVPRPAQQIANNRMRLINIRSQLSKSQMLNKEQKRIHKHRPDVNPTENVPEISSDTIDSIFSKCGVGNAWKVRMAENKNEDDIFTASAVKQIMTDAMTSKIQYATSNAMELIDKNWASLSAVTMGDNFQSLSNAMQATDHRSINLSSQCSLSCPVYGNVLPDKSCLRCGILYHTGCTINFRKKLLVNNDRLLAFRDRMLQRRCLPCMTKEVESMLTIIMRTMRHMMVSADVSLTFENPVPEKLRCNLPAANYWLTSSIKLFPPDVVGIGNAKLDDDLSVHYSSYKINLPYSPVFDMIIQPQRSVFLIRGFQFYKLTGKSFDIDNGVISIKLNGHFRISSMKQKLIIFVPSNESPKKILPSPSTSNSNNFLQIPTVDVISDDDIDQDSPIRDTVDADKLVIAEDDEIRDENTLSIVLDEIEMPEKARKSEGNSFKFLDNRYPESNEDCIEIKEELNYNLEIDHSDSSSDISPVIDRTGHTTKSNEVDVPAQNNTNGEFAYTELVKEHSEYSDATGLESNHEGIGLKENTDLVDISEFSYQTDSQCKDVGSESSSESDFLLDQDNYDSECKSALSQSDSGSTDDRSEHDDYEDSPGSQLDDSDSFEYMDSDGMAVETVGIGHDLDTNKEIENDERVAKVDKYTDASVTFENKCAQTDEAAASGKILLQRISCINNFLNFEILDTVFSHLDIHSRLQCRVVCRHWRRTIDSSPLLCGGEFRPRLGYELNINNVPALFRWLHRREVFHVDLRDVSTFSKTSADHLLRMCELEFNMRPEDFFIEELYVKSCSEDILERLNRTMPKLRVVRENIVETEIDI